MLKKISPGLLITVILFVAGFATLYVIERTQSQYDTIIDEATTPSTAQQLQKMHISDSLPHYLYQRIKDSIDGVREKEWNKNILHPGYGVTWRGLVGVRSAFRTMDTDSSLGLERSYYLSLPFYSLQMSCQVEMHEGKKYLRYPVWDGSKASGRQGHSEIREIPVYYFQEYNELLIPVSEKKFSALATFFKILLGIYFFAALYVIVGIPLNILLNISKGKVFIAENIRRLYLIAYILIGYFCLRVAVPYLLAMIFSAKIPAEFHVSFWDLLTDHWQTGVCALAMFGIGKAFKKGYQLQQEQDLTV